MAKKPAPKKSTTVTAPAATTSDKTAITVIKTATCSNLLGTATLGYEIGVDPETSALLWRVSSSTGKGYFSMDWVKFTDIESALTAWPKELPLTSMALRPLFTGSVNTASFLLATLLAEKVLAAVPDNKRHYQIGDIKTFLSVTAKLSLAHSKPAKAKPKAQTKAATRMPKSTAQPATGK